MRRGFTIIELLVASLLLGLLVTILTMVFNQSSIAWRTGIAGTGEMDDIREVIAEVRDEADNAFVYEKKLYRLTGLWDRNGNLRDRACDAPGSKDAAKNAAFLLGGGTARTGSSYWFRKLADLEPEDFLCYDVGVSGGTSGGSRPGANKSASSATGNANYTVNVMSAGPDRKFDTWDDVWSWPDDFE